MEVSSLQKPNSELSLFILELGVRKMTGYDNVVCPLKAEIV
jgi:hypothetical protein